MTGTTKPSVLFSSSNGYTFSEVFIPVIKEMGGSCRALVLASDFYLNESARKELSELKKNHVIEEFRIINPNREKESLRHYHKRLSAIAHSLSGLDIDMIVMSGDFQIDNRYILDPFLNPRVKKVVLQGGLIFRVLKAYRRAKGLDVGEAKKRPIDPLWPLRVLKKKARGVLSDFRQWQHHYFYPYWNQKKVFPVTGYEHLAFASGICEHAICYDPLLKEALQVANPLLKHVYVARHPLDTGSNEAWKKREEKMGRLLVLFAGNLKTEMSQEKINRWVEVVAQAVSLKNIREIHLRFHPRGTRLLKWPGVMTRSMEKLGCFVEVVDTKRVSLCESLALYDGVIGGPSAALRVARAINKSMFIIGLPNCSDGDDNDQSWALGSGEGICWVGEGGTVSNDQLNPSQVADNKHPRVSDILLGLLGLNSGDGSR